MARRRPKRWRSLCVSGFRGECPPTVCADARRIRQVIKIPSSSSFPEAPRFTEGFLRREFFLDLNGRILRIADWIRALYTYDKDGDYGVFAPLLGPAGELLRRAAFFERTSNPVKAREALSAWASREDRFPAGDPAAELFREELEQRVCWYRQPDRASWERELAERYLEQSDYVRAAIYGLVAIISAEVIRSGGNPVDFGQRDSAKEELLKSGHGGFPTLNNLRNALAHGVRPWDRRIVRALQNGANLRNRLKSLLGQLLGPQRIKRRT